MGTSERAEIGVVDEVMTPTLEIEFESQPDPI
jgi:hypothetical protein